MLLRGYDAGLLARRGGVIAWEEDAIGNVVGYAYANRLNQLVFCNETQQAGNDNCQGTYIDFNDGSLYVKGTDMSTALFNQTQGAILDFEYVTTQDESYTLSAEENTAGNVVHNFQHTTAMTQNCTSADFDTGSCRRVFTVFNGEDTGAANWQDSNELFSIYPTGYAYAASGMFLGADPTAATTGLDSPLFLNMLRINRDFVYNNDTSISVGQFIVSRTLNQHGYPQAGNGNSLTGF